MILDPVNPVNGFPVKYNIDQDKKKDQTSSYYGTPMSFVESKRGYLVC
jgi:hypothetical protein